MQIDFPPIFWPNLPIVARVAEKIREGFPNNLRENLRFVPGKPQIGPENHLMCSFHSMSEEELSFEKNLGLEENSLHQKNLVHGKNLLFDKKEEFEESLSFSESRMVLPQAPEAGKQVVLRQRLAKESQPLLPWSRKEKERFPRKKG
ncbi:MAG: hypothetical protein WA705_11985 [Candidatus Ozemobacteraceae bacterium]